MAAGSFDRAAGAILGPKAGRGRRNVVAAHTAPARCQCTAGFFPAQHGNSQFSIRMRQTKSVTAGSPERLRALADGEQLVSIVREGTTAESPRHVHSCGQLLYPERGAALLETPHHLVRLGPGQAAWIPPDLPHSILMGRPYRYHSVYIGAGLYAEPTFSVSHVSPLLKELILDAERWDDTDASSDVRFWKTRVIVAEIRRAPRVAAGMPIPDDPRISVICRALEIDPADARMLGDWARQVGASEKTLQRAFVKSTGLSFQQWRTHARMTKALAMHRCGARLLDVAVAVGYSSEGAYAHAFRQFYGYSPGRMKPRSTGDRTD
ncbi:helix-turn-helix domain-containing protein [Burkholderia ambifaria]|uniref:helix-turn-helix domain-containing protein n=1 Tax=Burkholderia ambifaria TaxID=152480 RepID=UPI0020122FC0|nr:AraC family transcriptional regulator [Burkholderia ambifaria]